MNMTQALRTAVDKLNQVAENNLPYDGVIELFTRLGYEVKTGSRRKEATVKKNIREQGIEIALMVDSVPAGIEDDVAYEDVGMYGTIRPLFQATIRQGIVPVVKPATDRFYQNRWKAQDSAATLAARQAEFDSYTSLTGRLD